MKAAKKNIRDTMPISNFIHAVCRLIVQLLIVSTAMHAQAMNEYQVKALFIYNFAKFVEWPPEAFAGPSDALTICISAQDPVGPQIQDAIRGKTINSRGIFVKRIMHSSDAKGCHVVFVAAPAKKDVEAVLAPLAATPVLSVGETEDFMDMGGVIGFAMAGNKIRFDINLGAAERARLKISSKLLSLARNVKEPVKP